MDIIGGIIGVNGPLDLNSIMVNIKVKQLKNKRIKYMLYLKFTKYIKKLYQIT